ncbi:MAG: HAD family hydrolase [Lachnospiraceae bacterium]
MYSGEIKKYKAVIFDLDGTLLDTLEDLKNSVNAALRKCGFQERSLEEIRSFVGNGIGKLIARSLDQGAENPKFDEVFEAFKVDYEKNCRILTKPYEGIRDMLVNLQERGYNVAIVSNKADFGVQELNQFFFRDFQFPAYGENETQKRKPAPDMLLNVMENFGATVENTVYVGDSEVDIQTASNAGVDCISVLWGFRGKEFLQEAGGTVFASSPAELLMLIEGTN